MQLNPAEISDLIKAKIENLSVNAEVAYPWYRCFCDRRYCATFMACQTRCKVRCSNSPVTLSVWP